MKTEPDDLPADPELDGTVLGHSVEGVETVAKLLGTMRRSCRMEGFSKREAFELCELWLVETFEAMGKTEEE